MGQKLSAEIERRISRTPLPNYFIHNIFNIKLINLFIIGLRDDVSSRASFQFPFLSRKFGDFCCFFFCAKQTPALIALTDLIAISEPQNPDIDELQEFEKTLIDKLPGTETAKRSVGFAALKPRCKYRVYFSQAQNFKMDRPTLSQSQSFKIASHIVSELHKSRRFPDFEALKSRKGRSGCPN